MIFYCFFSACGFFICGFVRCNCFCLLCVITDSFASLYVSEFLIAACGVSPLRGRPKDSALWNPAALERLANFFLWVRVCWCCSPEYKKQKPWECPPTAKGVIFYECRNHYRIYKTRSAPEILRCLRHRLRCQTAHHRR